MTQTNRRHTARFAALNLQARIDALDRPMRVLNVSEGGFLLDAPIELPRGKVERYIFTTDGGDEIRLHARVVHVLVRRLITDTSYLTGCEFVGIDAEVVQRAIGLLIRASRVAKDPPANISGT